MQVKAVERIFQRLTMSFGNQMVSKWQGIDPQGLYEDWADVLQNFTIGAIGYGISIAKQQKQPPCQSEFVDFCKLYKPEDLPRIERKFTPEEMEIGKKRISEIVENLKRGKCRG